MSYWNSLTWFAYAVNRFREENGREKLALSYKLCEDTQKHNQWMANSGGLNHCGLGIMASENVGFLGWKPPLETAFGEFFRLWMSDYEHREVLLSRGHFIGLALYYTNDGIFGTLRVI